MRRQTLLLRFEPRATPPTDDPPTFDVTSGPGTVTLLEGDEDGVPTSARYASHVTMTGEDTFEETGEITFDGGSFTLSTPIPGVMQEFPESGMVLGAVTWRVQGSGRFSGASGLVSSNFAFQTDGSGAIEEQVARIVLP
ncbi:hypothetical protein SAMN05661080_01070 [Modestobacter sp. DSM 44400]|uniref:hypothetical protein n=1 Tax=Modestobacter sp. DSM 44400 TaxID=1550230 RepID=UPI000896C98D|nr:hypothetical protein [Modestobacter sp. DSM 44400]SDX75576.1 hypothetical protein SAMN05661080_01070 [Modestobacter sp. DSM 44400]